MEEYQWLVSMYGLQAVGFVGMLMHFFNKRIKGETLVDIAGFFTSNLKSTIVAVISTVIAVAGYYFSLGTGQAADILTVFGLGYMCDSFFNKWDK